MSRPAWLRSVLLAVLAALLASPAVAAPDRTVIEGGERVGSYRLGHSFDTYAKVLGKPTRVIPSDISKDAHGVFYKRYGLLFLIKKGMVNGITVSSPLLATKEGIRVGSFREDVERIYGPPQAVSSSYVRYPERGLAFSFQDGKVTRIAVVDRDVRDLASGDWRIVPGVRVGGLELGQSLKFVEGQWKQPDKRAPFVAKKGAELWWYRNHGLWVVAYRGRVGGLMLYSPGFRTGRDIHVGSTRHAVVAAYGPPQKSDENRESYPRQGITFLYEGGKVLQIWVLDTEFR